MNVQRNYCKKLLRSTKKSYFKNLDISKIKDNRSFWKTIVPLFSKRASKSEKFSLTEEGKNISDNAESCRIFNNHFQFENTKFDKKYNAVDTNTISYPLSIATKLYDQHPSNVNIRRKISIRYWIKKEKKSSMHLSRKSN